MKIIKRKSAVKVSKLEGNIVDTTNIKDKKKNTYSANVIEKLIEDNVPDVEVPTKTSQLINDSGFITGLKISSIVITNHAILGATNLMPNNSKTGTVNATKSGYYPIGIAGWEASGIDPFYISSASLGTASIYYKATNPHPNQITCYLNVRIIWAK